MGHVNTFDRLQVLYADHFTNGTRLNKLLQFSVVWIVPQHMAVILAEQLEGQNWQNTFSSMVSGAEKVTF